MKIYPHETDLGVDCIVDDEGTMRHPRELDDFAALKRLTESELTFEYHRSAYLTGIHGPYAEGNRVAALSRFLTRPHASEADYE